MPDRPLRVGVAGLGRAFTLMLPTLLKDPRVRLVAACDPREPARSQFSRDFTAPVYSSIEGLAANKEVEAIYIASPHQFHAEQTRVAALHGKHVLVEKPMALSLAECDQMIADCARAGVRLIVGHCHSFDTPYLRARDLIDEGGLGRVRMIHALNYTDFLYRPRRPEELQTSQGGGVVYSQAAHQVDIVRLMAGSRVTQVRAVTGAWDPNRPTEGAYCALLWFADDTFASITYSGYGHFDSDEWCDWIGEMGQEKSPADHGAARRRLCASGSPEQEAHLKAAATYGGPAYKQPSLSGPTARHQHFGPLLVSCEHADVRPMPTGVWVYADAQQILHPLGAPDVPRAEVVDELYGAVIHNVQPLHNGMWARETLAVCLALLESAANKKDIRL